MRHERLLLAADSQQFASVTWYASVSRGGRAGLTMHILSVIVGVILELSILRGK